MEFGKKLKELRNNNNLLQKDIAKMLNVRNTTVSAWENGDNEPSISDIKKLAAILDCTTDELLDFNSFDYDFDLKKQ